MGTDATGAGRLWGARLQAAPADAAWALGVSTAVDGRLWRQDLAGSRAHAGELHRIGVLDDAEHDRLLAALDRCADLFADEAFPFRDDDEDVHGAIERWLVDDLGPLGGKLRAGRSRNDQIANDLRLYLKDATTGVVAGIRGVQRALLDQAEVHLGTDDRPATLAPGMTHLQRGQPVLLSHLLLAWVWMLERDAGRFLDARARIDESVLGSGALAGLTLDLDPAAYAASLGFARVAPNSMDAVAARDGATEFLAAAAILSVTCSRIGEELVLWSTAEFGYARVGDAFSTGSSIMPQKRNPDIAELVRGKTGRVVGDLVALLTTVKGLPMTYNRDLQEDKEPVFDAVDTLELVLPALAGTIASLQFDVDRLATAAAGGFSLATDLAEELVRRGVPFRDAHEVVGGLVRRAEQAGVDLDGLDPAVIADAHDALDTSVAELLDVRAAVERRDASLGTAPGSVRVQLEHARRLVGAQSDDRPGREGGA
ncbi:argininosuccinate lyase [Salsipaludibacter albus]|uniref:argininosuccinate lyase n=1 Tax=Salsipaludibacter albus TaxID=2849650 RepID=UPI001EE3AD5D|nr:argininosuccinate lyase [Salsipaludibacter albus]MBY5163805.1 argininosuccinate lyase [Salsipaludibacter albus]